MRKHTAPGMEGPSGPSRGVRLNQRPRRTTRSPVSALHTATPQLRSLCALSPERPAGLLWRGATQTAGLGTDTRRAPKGRETGASRPLQPSRGLGFGGSRSCCLGTPATRGDQGSVCSQPPKPCDRRTADSWPQTDSAGGSPAGPGPAPHAGRAPRGRAAADGAPVPPVRGAGGGVLTPQASEPERGPGREFEEDRHPGERRRERPAMEAPRRPGRRSGGQHSPLHCPRPLQAKAGELQKETWAAPGDPGPRVQRIQVFLARMTAKALPKGSARNTGSVRPTEQAPAPRRARYARPPGARPRPPHLPSSRACTALSPRVLPGRHRKAAGLPGHLQVTAPLCSRTDVFRVFFHAGHLCKLYLSLPNREMGKILPISSTRKPQRRAAESPRSRTHRLRRRDRSQALPPTPGFAPHGPTGLPPTPFNLFIFASL